MKALISAFKYVGIFALTLLVLWGVLIGAAFIPDSAIHDNMLESALAYKDATPYEFAGNSLASVTDNYADVIMLQLAYNIGRAPLTSTLNTRYYDGGDYGHSVGFYLSLLDATIEPNVDYTRYWHGSAAIIRALHLFTSVDGIKLISFFAVLIAALAVLALLIKRRCFDIAAAFVISLIAVQIWNVRLSLEYPAAFIIAFIACALALVLEPRGDASLYPVFIIGATAVAFFDFLTTETLTLTLPLIFTVAVRAREGRLGDTKRSLALILKSSIAWGVSYAATFVAKWTLATLVTGENKFAAAFSSAGERFVGDTAAYGLESPIARIFFAPLSNVSALLGSYERLEPMRVVVGLSLLAVAAVSILYLFAKKPYNKSASALLALLGAVVFLRFALLGNHSYIHSFFTYRALLSTVLALLLILRLNVGLPDKKKLGRKKK